MLLGTCLKQMEKKRAKLAKWKKWVSERDMVTHVVDQTYVADWFLEAHMTEWKEHGDANIHGKSASNIMRKSYHELKNHKG